MVAQRDLYVVATAALLHDIGKAFHKLTGSISEDLSIDGKNYHHYIGARLVELASESASDASAKEDLKKISLLIKAHHEKQGENWNEENPYFKEVMEGNDEDLKAMLEAIIYADHLSSSERDKAKKGLRTNRKLIPLFPLKDALKAEDKEKLLGGYDNYDFNNVLDEPTSKKTLLNMLKLHLINYNPSPAWIQTLITILKNFCFDIPSYGQSDIPFISLYTHSITVAAIASSRYLDPNIYLGVIKIGGLQNFITALEDRDFRGEGAARLLRGRSRYVECLTRALSYEVTSKCGLTPASIVLATSGKAILILPSSKVDEAKRVVDAKKDHLLSRGIDQLKIGFGCEKYEKRDVSEAISEAFSKAEQDSYRQNPPRPLLQPLKAHYCETCGTVTKNKNGGDCEVCFECKSLGRIDSLIVYGVNNGDFKVATSVVKAPDKIVETPTLSKIGGIKKELEEGVPIGISLRLMPENINNNLDKLLSAEEKDKRPIMAVVALDFDRLGSRYVEKSKEGLSSNIEFSLWMEKWIVKNLSDAFGGSSFFLLYAGGDDVVFAGKIDECLSAIKKLKNKLSDLQAPMRSVSTYDEITFTSTYSLYKKGYPIARAFTEAEDRLKELKSSSNDLRGHLYLSYVPALDPYSKTIPLFERNGNRNFFNNFVKNAEELKNLIEEKKISKSFIYWLKSLHDSIRVLENLPTNRKKNRLHKFLELKLKGKIAYGWNKKQTSSKTAATYGRLQDMKSVVGEEYFFPLIFTSVMLAKEGV